MSLDLIKMWHERARPAVNNKAFNVQLGCHFEEIWEMLHCIRGLDESTNKRLDEVFDSVDKLATGLKSGEYWCEVADKRRRAFLDAIADQIVTGVGVAHCAKMNVTEAVRRVNASNWSKFDQDGKPYTDANGKVSKGPNYAPPNLEGLY